MAVQQSIQQTLQTWQPYYAQELTEADGQEILENWSAYVWLIAEWAAIAEEGCTPQ